MLAISLQTFSTFSSLLITKTIAMIQQIDEDLYLLNQFGILTPTATEILESVEL